MRRTLRDRLQYHFHHPNYLFFMMSLMLLILMPPIAYSFSGGRLWFTLFYGLVILMGVVFTTNNLTEFIVLLVLGVFVFSSFLFGHGRAWFSLGNAAVHLLFFFFVLINLVKYVVQMEEVTSSGLFASISGYLVLGIVAAPLFSIIHIFNPEAFSADTTLEHYDFIYYSFVTLTSIGFGDIVPLHPIAKSVTVILGLSGQLYLTCLIAVIIGKYLAQNVDATYSRENLKQ